MTSRGKISDKARLIIVKTNHLWPFSAINKVPYLLAERRFLSGCRRLRGIRSVYLRNSMARGFAVPGLSDIDFTIVTDPNLTAEEEFKLLKEFWKEYKRSKTFFPMLGEIGILSERHLREYTKRSIRGYESKYWVLRYGADTVAPNYAATPERIERDSMDYAVENYLGPFLKKYYNGGNPDQLFIMEMKRLAAKILRYAHNRAQREDETSGLGEDKEDVICAVLAGLDLEAGKTALPQSLAPEDCPAPAPFWRGEGGEAPPTDEKLLAYVQMLEPDPSEVEGVFLASSRHQRVYIVLASGLVPGRIRALIGTITDVSARYGIKPVIVTPALLEYILRVYHPMEHLRLLKWRLILWGCDPMPKVGLPSKDLAIERAKDPLVLLVPSSREMIDPPDPKWYGTKEFYRNLEWVLRIKFIVEDGTPLPFYNEPMAECAKRYPEYHKQIKRLRGKTDFTPHNSPSEEWHKILSALIDGISLDFSKPPHEPKPPQT